MAAEICRSHAWCPVFQMSFEGRPEPEEYLLACCGLDYACALVSSCLFSLPAAITFGNSIHMHRKASYIIDA